MMAKESSRKSEKRNPHKILSTFFEHMADFSFRNKKITIPIVCVVLFLSPFIIRNLRMDTSTASMSSKDDPVSQIYWRSFQQFGEAHPLVILLRYQDIPLDQVDAFVESFVEDIEGWDDIRHVEWRFLDLEEERMSEMLIEAALLNSDPPTIQTFLHRFTEDGMRRTLRNARRKLIAAEDPDMRELIIKDLLDISGLLLPYYESRSGSIHFSHQRNTFDSTEEDARLLFVYPLHPSEDSVYSQELLQRVENALDSVKKANPAAENIEWMFSGKYAVAGEGMEIISEDMKRITLLAGVLMIMLLLLVFRNLRALLISFVPMAISLVAVLMIAALFFNPLNYIAMTFTAILIGLSIDIMFHCTGRFTQLLANASSAQEAVRQTLKECGPPLTLGLTTTAAAFLCLVFARYEALRDFGLLTSLGLMIMLFLSLFLYSPAVHVFYSRASRARIKSLRFRKAPASFFSFFLNRPGLSLGIVFLFLVSSLCFVPRFRFEMDLFSGLPRQMDSLDTAEIVSETFGASYMLSTQLMIESSSLENAMQAQKQADMLLTQLTESGSIAGFQSPSQFIPYSLKDAEMFDKIAQVVKEGRTLFFRLLAEYRFQLSPEIERYYGFLENLGQEENEGDPFGKNRYLNASPEIEKFITEHSGTIYLQSYIWPIHQSREYTIDRDFIERLEDQIQSLPEIEDTSLFLTGTYHVYEHISLLLKQDFFRVGFICLIAIFILVWAYFRRISLVAMCLVPLTVALLSTMALVVIARFPFTPMSAGYLAIIFGIGIDDAIHILSRIRNGSRNELKKIIDDIAVLLFLTSLSTSIGFGALMISRLYTLSSTGFVIATGVLLCLVMTALFVPPGYILLFSSKRSINKR